MNGLQYKSFSDLIKIDSATDMYDIKKRYLNNFNHRKEMTKENSQLSRVLKIDRKHIILKLSLHRHHPIHHSAVVDCVFVTCHD